MSDYQNNTYNVLGHKRTLVANIYEANHSKGTVVSIKFWVYTRLVKLL